MTDLDLLREAGKINAKARAYGLPLIKPGASILEVTDKIEDKILSLGGELAFPVQISRNDIAAHYCPGEDDETLFEEGDVVCMDIGVHKEGMIADAAHPKDLGSNTKLCEAAIEALNAALKTVKPGVEVCKVGEAIEEVAIKYGFKPVRNLSGHGLGKYKVHSAPSIPNFNNGDNTQLEDGQIIAIEPFVSNGAGIVVEDEDCEVFMQLGKKPVRSMMVRKVLNEILKYNGLPFTTRWLSRQFSLAQVNFALKEMLRLDIIRSYGPLVDKNNGLVAQAEHTVIVGEKNEIITQ